MRLTILCWYLLWSGLAGGACDSPISFDWGRSGLSPPVLPNPGQPQSKSAGQVICINQINKYTSDRDLIMSYMYSRHMSYCLGLVHCWWLWTCDLVSPVLSRLAIASNRPKREPRPKSIKVNTINTQQNGSSHRSSVKSVISSGDWLNCWAILICSIHFHNVISVLFISVNYVLLL